MLENHLATEYEEILKRHAPELDMTIDQTDPLPTMTTLTAQIPDSLARKLAELAAGEHVAVDQIVAIALASQLAGWEVRNSVEARARRGKVADLRQALDRVPERPPLEGDEL